MVSLSAVRNALVTGIVLFASVVAYAQGRGIPGVNLPRGFAEPRRPSDERPSVPDFPSTAPTPAFILPPVKPAPSEQLLLSSQVRMFVRSFRILGNTVLDPEELKAAAAPYVGREVSSEELQELRRKLTNCTWMPTISALV
jgi:hypothetical protein